MDNKELSELKMVLDTRHKSPSLLTRKKALQKMKGMLILHEHDFLSALQRDLSKSSFEAYSSEIAVLLNEIDYVCKHLKKWMKLSNSYHLKLGYIETIRKTRAPYGRVLIISPWNYPLQLALMPAISAVAAGNSCVIKPSEFSPATGELLKTLVNKYFSPEQLRVVTGDAETAKKLISLNFNFLFFTGSKKTGKSVYHQAAEHLTPVVMELGGKNACIVDQTAFSEQNMKEIVWGKFLNAGQTCIAPDTLFVHESIYDKTLSTLKRIIVEFYSDRPENSKDFGRIVHRGHFERLIKVMSEGNIVHGGSADLDSLFISPTILTDINSNSLSMGEEIFGPILPVVPYKDLRTLLETGWIQHDSLTTYLFSKSSSHKRLLSQYSNSTISINKVIHHAASRSVAFGGNGKSGFGAYHGKAGFDECSYERTFYKANNYKHIEKKYPPYSEKEFFLMKKLRKLLV